MRYSFYEVYVTALRAFSGMGFPYGADEDAAFIIAWLELNNFNGIKLLVNSIDIIDNRYSGENKIDNNEFIINLKNSSVLMKGPALIDYFESKLGQKKKIEIIINNCLDAHYFIPLLYKISPKIIFSKLIYLNSNNKKMIYVFKKNLMQAGLSSHEIAVEKKQVKIMMSSEDDLFFPDVIKREISSSTMQNNLAKSLNPNIEDWEIIEKIAQRTFVPESEESRIKGAGGGDDND